RRAGRPGHRAGRRQDRRGRFAHAGAAAVRQRHPGRRSGRIRLPDGIAPPGPEIRDSISGSGQWDPWRGGTTMLNSGIIDLAIGMAFIFGATAGLASVITELVARFLGLRGAYLLAGLREL